jgi:hypothetical protein
MVDLLFDTLVSLSLSLSLEDSEADVARVLARDFGVEESEASAAELSSVLDTVPARPSPLTKKP